MITSHDALRYAKACASCYYFPQASLLSLGVVCTAISHPIIPLITPSPCRSTKIYSLLAFESRLLSNTSRIPAIEVSTRNQPHPHRSFVISSNLVFPVLYKYILRSSLLQVDFRTFALYTSERSAGSFVRID